MCHNCFGPDSVAYVWLAWKWSLMNALFMWLHHGPAADGGGGDATAGVSHDLYCADTVSIADSDISFATSTKSADSRFTRSTRY